MFIYVNCIIVNIMNPSVPTGMLDDFFFKVGKIRGW